MLMTLGPLAFEVAPFNAHQVARSVGADFAEKAIMGRAPKLEFTGYSAETYSISSAIFPKRIGGLEQLEQLDALRIDAAPLYLMRGDGEALGWFVIASIGESHEHLSGDGVGQKISIDIELKRTDPPDNADFHGSSDF